MSDQPGQIPANIVQQISAQQFGAKYQSKREVYMFLTISCKAYLPRYENVTI